MPLLPTTEAEIVCRAARQEDFAAASALLDRYRVDRLSAEQRKEGFISAAFTPKQLRQMAEHAGVFVAVSQGRILGCLCCDDSASPALPAPYLSMRGHFDAWRFRARPLSAWRCFAYGPICIDASARGKGLLGRLFATMLTQLRPGYQVGTAFIAKTNPRSLAAHVDRLGMTAVGEFGHARAVSPGEEAVIDEFVALAFALD